MKNLNPSTPNPSKSTVLTQRKNPTCLRKKSKIPSMIETLKLATSVFLKKIKNCNKKVKDKLQLAMIKPPSLNLLPRVHLPADQNPYSNVSSHCSKKILQLFKLI